MSESDDGSVGVGERDSRLKEASTSGRAEVVQITFPKSAQGGIGLSIVCAQGVGERETGIYVKKVVPDSAADRDGRLEAGDQLLKVNGHNLVGIEQEEAARLMASSGPTVSFEVGKQAALYNGLATWLYSTSPEASPRVMAPPRAYTPTQHHQRVASVSSMGGPPPSGYGRMVNHGGHPPPSLENSQHGRSLSHTSLEYGGQGANYQNMTFHNPQPQRPPSVHGTTEFQRATPTQPQVNSGYGMPTRVANGYVRQSSATQQQQSMTRSYEARGSVSSLRSGSQAPPSPRLMSQSMDRNTAPNGIFRAPHSPSPLSATNTNAFNYANLQLRSHGRESRQSPVPDYPRETSPPLPPPPPHIEPYRPEPTERAPSRNGHSQHSPPRTPLTNNNVVNIPADREEAEQLEARMNIEVVRLMEEEVSRLEGKEYLSEAEERRYRAIKYDLAYKRRLLEDDDEEDDERSPQQMLQQLNGLKDNRLAGGMDDVNRLQDEMERSLRTEAAPVYNPPPPTQPQKRVPPAVPPKKKTVQFQPPSSTSTASSASLSPRHDEPRMETPPVDYSRRYVYEKSETEEPRAQVIGAQEVYRDPRQQRLAKQQTNAPANSVDGTALDFRAKMRLFAAQLGEGTPKQGAKSSSKQREIEDTILTPQN